MLQQNAPAKIVKVSQSRSSLCNCCHQSNHQLTQCIKYYKAFQLDTIICLVCRKKGHICCTPFADNASLQWETAHQIPVDMNPISTHNSDPLFSDALEEKDTKCDDKCIVFDKYNNVIDVEFMNYMKSLTTNCKQCNKCANKEHCSTDCPMQNTNN